MKIFLTISTIFRKKTRKLPKSAVVKMRRTFK